VTPKVERILVCIDFSGVTERVVGYARTVSALAGAEVRLLHVGAPNPDFVGFEAGPDVVRNQVANTLRDEHRKLELFAEVFTDANVHATPLMVQGPTADTILEQARRFSADLVVLGSHGHGALYDLIAGSVARDVLEKSSVPVLVVPAKRRTPMP
jgi:nucleotide-binding universal stress UspA family protein